MPLRPIGQVTDYIAIPWLDDLAARTTHLSLMTANPFSVADPKTVEPPGAIYSRSIVRWQRQGRLLRNVNELIWSGLLQGVEIVAISGWNSAFVGQMTYAAPFGPLDYSQTTSGGVIIPIGSLYVGLDR